MKKTRVEKAQHHQWFGLFYYKLFDYVIEYLVNKAIDFACIVCGRNHLNKSALITCLRTHRVFTANYYLDNCLVRMSFQ